MIRVIVFHERRAPIGVMVAGWDLGLSATAAAIICHHDAGGLLVRGVRNYRSEWDRRPPRKVSDGGESRRGVPRPQRVGIVGGRESFQDERGSLRQMEDGEHPRMPYVHLTTPPHKKTEEGGQWPAATPATKMDLK